MNSGKSSDRVLSGVAIFLNINEYWENWLLNFYKFYYE